jgi:beta-fructofuranosidase
MLENTLKDSSGELREAMAGDPHRPLYHFTASANWMNDPNGPIFWKGWYHMFYQYNPNEARWGDIHWGHARSADLVHWEDLPIALTPSPDGPDQAGCWSGCVVDDNGVPTAFYTGLEPQSVCVATGDDDLIHWTKHPSPVIGGPPKELNLTGFPSITGHASADFRDPYVWREGEQWFLLIGSGMREQGGTALLYRSKDLQKWEFIRPIWTAVIGSDCNMWECPILVRDSQSHILLVSPHPEAKYIYWVSGTLEDYRFKEIRRGKVDLGELVYAPQCLVQPDRKRKLLWTWIKEARTTEAQLASGWSGVLCLPREIHLDENGGLLFVPAPELEGLRTSERRWHQQTISPDSGNVFREIYGDLIEIDSVLRPKPNSIWSLVVRANPDDAEQTKITFDIALQTFTVDGTFSSLDSSVERKAVSGPLILERDGLIRIRMFLDRSVVELFIDNRFSVTQRLYPTRPDSSGLKMVVEKGSIDIVELSLWTLRSIWPDSDSRGTLKTRVPSQAL